MVHGDVVQIRGRFLSFLFFLLILLCFILGPQKSLAEVWSTRRSWTPQWEQEYRSWVSSNWGAGFFTRPGPYKGLKLDCADVVYVMRAIFAAEYGLPFVINDPSGGGGVISNRMSRFNGLSADQKKREFAKYLFGVTSTKSLPRDSYPTAINRSTLGAGSFLLTVAGSHHSWTVRTFLPTGIPHLVFSSRPAKTILFERKEYPTMDFTFKGSLKPENHAGFRKFRSERDLKESVWDVSGYSLEQYQIPYKAWRGEMQRRMASRAEGSEELLARLFDSACQGVQERVVAVSEALQRLKQMDASGRRCMTAPEYDDFSTPSRDKRLIGNFVDLVNAYRNLSANGRLGSGRYARIVGDVIQGGAEGYCDVKVPGRGSVSLGQVLVSGINGVLSSNPHDSASARWGLSNSGARARSCPTY